MASRLLITLGIGAAIAIAWALFGRPIGVFPLASAVTGLGAVFAAIGITEIFLLRRLEGLQRDVAAEAVPYKALMLVIGFGIILAIGFAATGTQLGVVPLASAVTALGITAAVLTATMAIILVSIRTSDSSRP